MPALVVCNRRWKVGSDDFVYPAIFLLVLRVIWIITLIGVFIQHTGVFQCTGKEILTVYFIGMLILLAIKVGLNIAILATSMRGSIMFAQPRSRLPGLLLAKLISTVIEIVWTGLGTYWAFDDSSGCDPTIIDTVKCLVIIGWICTAFGLIGLVLAFDIFGGLNNGEYGKASKSWQKICRILCCHPYNDEISNAAFSELAQLLSEFFLGDELVPTDIAAGLVLLSHQQAEPKDSEDVYLEMSASAGAVLSQPSLTRQTLHGDVSAPPSWMTIGNAAYYMKYALASYGCPFYTFSHMPLGCCRLCFVNKRGCCLSNDDFPNLEGDNCCHCNASAIGHTIDLHSIDIHYATFENKLYEPPFFIGIDRFKRSIVISVRGTLSLKDVVTDLTLTGEPLDVPLVAGLQCTVHKGMFKSAKRLYEKIEANRYLEEALEDNPGFNLVVTGHSLGAGVAKLLALLLYEKFPSVRCFAFSPPGCVLSEEAASRIEHFVLAVVVGDDVVPRLSLRSVELLRKNVSTALCTTNIPKYKILAHGCSALCCKKYSGCLNDQEDRAPLLGNQYVALDQDEPDFRLPVTAQKMYIGGRIMTLVEPEEGASESAGGDTAGWSWRWSTKDDFGEIKVTKYMVSHHMPDFVEKCLSQLNEHVHN